MKHTELTPADLDAANVKNIFWCPKHREYFSNNCSGCSSSRDFKLGYKKGQQDMIEARGKGLFAIDSIGRTSCPFSCRGMEAHNA